MNKSIYKMKLHESLTIKGSDTSILRVPGGWIYSTYHPYGGNYQTNPEYRASTVFVPLTCVPLTCEGKEHE